MKLQPARPPKTDKATKAVIAASLPAISPRDSAALGLALDACAPPDAAQEDILRRVLQAINTEAEGARASKGSTPER
jgi:hypothetical protein